MIDEAEQNIIDPEPRMLFRCGNEAVVSRILYEDTHNLAEGAGAAPLAALLRERARLAGKRAAVVLSGGNIDLALFRSWVLREGPARAAAGS